MTTKIEWAEETWNPVTGCTKVSPGCEHCYAERMAKRLKGMGLPQYQNVVDGNGWTGKVTLARDQLEKPLHWRKPRRVFVCSMSDLFHERVPDLYIDEVWEVMCAARQHTFQVLTKRARRMRRWKYKLNHTLRNVWYGVTVCAPDELSKLDDLRETPAAVRFVSFEPLLADIGQVDLSGIDWVICGGESGPGARPMHPDSPRSLRDQCAAASVPFFFKQWGDHPWQWCKTMVTAGWDVNAKKGGRVLDGREWNQYPKVEP